MFHVTDFTTDFVINFIIFQIYYILQTLIPIAMGALQISCDETNDDEWWSMIEHYLMRDFH